MNEELRNEKLTDSQLLHSLFLQREDHHNHLSYEKELQVFAKQ